MRGNDGARVEVRPNPARGKTTLQMQLPTVVTEVTVELTDRSGKSSYKAVHSAEAQLELSLEALNSGIYQVCVSYGDQSHCNQLVIIE